jgi:opacity protein-like surface antigen
VKFLGIKFGEADYNMVNINGKYFFNMSQPAQPFLMAGMNIPWLVVENGSANATTVGDGFFYGVGLNLGGGLSYYFTPRIVLNLALIYRVIGYYTAEGVNGTRDEIKDPLFGGGLGINTGMAFTF